MTFTDKLPHQLPAFMNDIVARSQNHVDADMLVLSSLTAISALSKANMLADVFILTFSLCLLLLLRLVRVASC
mgnify:CR=1 FL=1